MTSGRRVALIADARFPIREPFAGGLQSMTWHLAAGLRDRGWEVTVCAAPGTDESLRVRLLDVSEWECSPAARQDVSMPPRSWMREHHAYLDLMMSLARSADVDLVHNNCLHHLPIALAELLPIPFVTTLHTPPTPWLESALDVGTSRQHFVAVSGHTARAWSHALPRQPAVIYNGVDPRRWPQGPGGDALAWMGRLCPEKGAHLAIEIARAAGMRLRLAGPVSDPAYFAAEIEPRLGSGVEYLGHLAQAELADLVGHSAACLVTPVWDEPYGLVAAEALACGTPVLGFARGGLPEVVDRHTARLVPDSDVEAAAALAPEVVALSRDAARARGVAWCSADAMIERYVALYEELLARTPPALC